MSQIVDTATAQEFMKETMDKIEMQDLVSISQALEVKSGIFRNRLATEYIDTLTDEDLADTLRLVFSTRRKSNDILKVTGYSTMKEHMRELLHGSDPVEVRFQKFCDSLVDVDEHIRYDLAGELLHYTFPDKYWLWCHWMWNPKLKTGSLPLVTTEDYDLTSPTLGESYLKVGEAIAFVHAVGDAAGFQTISKSLFGTNVYLSCVYVIYAYTVLRMRMTQEFNQVMPGVTEFASRILGVYRIHENVN